MQLYNLVVGEGGMWGDGAVTLDEYTNVYDFIDDSEYWLPANGGVFWKRSKDQGWSKKYNTKTWPAREVKEIKECFDYNNVEKRPKNKAKILEAFAAMAELLQERGYMIVPYGFEYGMDYLCIHKDDWSVLRNTKIKRNKWGDDEVVR